MKYYDYKLAKIIIETFKKSTDLQEAALGMKEDWFWTGQTIFEEGEYTHSLPENAPEIHKEYGDKRKNGMSILSDEATKYNEIFINGIYGSNWATPVIQLSYNDNEQIMFNCFHGSSNVDELTKIEKSLNLTDGCLSGPCQEYMDQIEVKEFKQH